MIRRFAIIALMTLLFSMPVLAETKIFLTPQRGSAEHPSTFNTPAKKKWSLHNLFSRNARPPEKAREVILTDGSTGKVTTNMLSMAYQPQSSDELMAIASARREWEDDSLKHLDEVNQMVLKKRAQEIAQDRERRRQEQIAWETEQRQQAASTYQPVAQAAAAPPRKKVIYNDPSATRKPKKVFGGY